MDVGPGCGEGVSREEDDGQNVVAKVHKEAFAAFMRLSLVKHRISSLNYAMINMRDSKGEMSAMFNCIHCVSDSLVSKNMDKGKVQQLMGSAYMPMLSSGRSAHAIPFTIQDLSLEGLRQCLSEIVDLHFKCAEGDGKELFGALMDAMSLNNLFEQSCFAKERGAYGTFLEELAGVVNNLAKSGTGTLVNVRSLIVFDYNMDSLISRENPAAFLDIMIHKHVY